MGLLDLRKKAPFKPATRKSVVYHEYIHSDAWKRKRAQALKKAGYRCQVCNKSNAITQLHVHHRTYVRLGHENLNDLTVLCEDCHDLFHSRRRLHQGD